MARSNNPSGGEKAPEERRTEAILTRVTPAEKAALEGAREALGLDTLADAMRALPRIVDTLTERQKARVRR